MPTVDELCVLLNGQLIGHLYRSDSQAPRFTYHAQYVADSDLALSASLPLTSTQYAAERAAPYFLGLLPENEGALIAWGEQLDVDPHDWFALLGAMGLDCPGAVQFVHPDDLETVVSEEGTYLPVSETDIEARLRAVAGDNASWSMKGEHWSLAGQQEKFALAYLEGQWFSARGAAATTHILKPGIKTLRHQALAEHLTLTAAGLVGVDVAPSGFQRFGDQWAIVSTRYDRVIAGHQVTRIHQEDVAQACRRLPSRKYETNGGPGLRTMANMLQRESTDLAADRRALAEFALINLVAGAPDGHAKNISLLRTPSAIHVAPLYDLATGLIYEAATTDRSIAVSIGGERLASRIRRKQLDNAALAIGVSADWFAERASELAATFPAAFVDACAANLDTPGCLEILERAVPELTRHSELLLTNFAS